MIILKSQDEIEIMEEAAAVTRRILLELPEVVRAGISTKDIDSFVEEEIRKSGQQPAFKGYEGFPACACISVNSEVVHGIPSKKRILREGDIVSVDLGTICKGYYSDAARTYRVGKVSEEADRLVRVTEECFFEGLKFCRPGYRLSDVSHAIQVHAESAGFSVVRDYVGHGIGRHMHEDPQVPNYGRPGRGPRLVPGMVLAVEPMISAGDYEVEVLSNDWTARTVDDSLAAHYENTVVITESEPRLLTL